MTDPFTVIIPARYGSERLPGKPLLDICGKSMIQRVFEQACLSRADRVIIATDDERVKQVSEGFGAQVCMTRPEHPSGTDRLQEVVQLLGFGDEEVVVNVQGDEPLIPPILINQVAENLSASGFPMATLSEPIDDIADVLDPNKVKVVADLVGRALYFSRASIPWHRDNFQKETSVLPSNSNGNWQRHLGIYAYRVKLLNEFVDWEPVVLESIEKLEQLRALVHGVSIHVAPADLSMPPGVDTEADLNRTREYIASLT